MGKKSILTSKQYNFLELAEKDRWLTKNYFLTGGTALSEFYLHHRLSEDLDFFSEKEISPRSIKNFIKKVTKDLSIKSFETVTYFGLEIYLLHFTDGESLKVDFAYNPFPPIDKFTHKGRLRISSLYDIAVDKLQTISGKIRPRDYVNLYFILKEKKYRIKKILDDIRAKFDWIIEPGSLSSQFLKVKDINHNGFPKMLASFNPKDMEDFFLSLAKSLEKEIFE